MKDRKTEYRSQKPIFYLVFSILCFLSSILCPSFADTPDIYLSITRTGGSKIKIAIPDFSLQEGITDRENLSSKGAEILREDLEISGLFKTIDNKDILNEVDSKDKKSGKINFKEWASMGTEAIVKGHINVEEGKFNIECRLYDVKRGEQITSYNLHSILNFPSSTFICPFTIASVPMDAHSLKFIFPDFLSFESTSFKMSLLSMVLNRPEISRSSLNISAPLLERFSLSVIPSCREKTFQAKVQK